MIHKPAKTPMPEMVKSFSSTNNPIPRYLGREHYLLHTPLPCVGSDEVHWWHAALVMALVAAITGGRLALLNIWPSYKLASDQSNQIVRHLLEAIFLT